MHARRFYWALLTSALLAPSARGALIAADNLHGTAVNSHIFIGVGYTDGDTFINGAAAQEFVAQVSGEVTTLLATVSSHNPGSEPLTIGIHQKSGGTVGALVGQVSFQPALVPGAMGINSLDLSGANIDLVAGQSYYATFTPPTHLF